VARSDDGCYTLGAITLGTTMLPKRTRPPDEISALKEWLDTEFKFTHFITLATNDSRVALRTRNKLASKDSQLKNERLRDLLREWDARVNRELNGPKWLQHKEELTFWFAFFEKPVSNPHWHLLFRIDFFDHLLPDPRLDRLTVVATAHWQKLVPSGSVSVKQITARSERVTDYVAKELGHNVQYESYIVPDDFRPR